MIQSMLVSMDMFPNRVGLNVKSSDQYKTSTGTILTVVVLGLTLIEAVTSLNGIFTYNGPQITVEKDYNSDPLQLGLNFSNFIFAFRVNDFSYNLSRSYVSFQLSTFSVVRNPDNTVNFITKQIPLEKCTLEYFKGFEQDYEALLLDSALCPSIDAIDIVGQYINDNFTYLNLNARSCQNDSTQPDVICQPIEGVRAALAGTVQLEIFLSNNIFTPSNHSEPVSRFIQEVYWDTAPNFTTMEVDLFLNQQTIISDDFVWLSGYRMKNITTYQMDLAEIRTNFQKLQATSPDNFSIFQMEIKRSPYVYTTNRSYNSVYTALSSIGGIFSLIFGIAGIAVAVYTRKAYLVSVANEMYDFEIPDYFDEKQNRRKCCKCLRRRKKDKVEEEPDYLSSIAKINISSKDPAQKERLKKLSRYLMKNSRSNKKTLEYGFCDFLISIISCGKREKDRFVRRAIETVTQDTDVLHLIKGMHETERLKAVLLTEEQQDLLTYSAHPVIVTSDLWKYQKVEEPMVIEGLDGKGPKAIKAKTKSLSGEEEGGSNGSGQNQDKKQVARIFSLKKKNSLTSTEKERNTQEIEFERYMKLVKSYQKVFRESQNPTNYKILELLEAGMHEALYEMSRQIKDDSFADKNPIKRMNSATSNKAVVLTKKNDMLAKLEAATKIVNRIKKSYRERKQRSHGSGGSVSDDDGGSKDRISKSFSYDAARNNDSPKHFGGESPSRPKSRFGRQQTSITDREEGGPRNRLLSGGGEESKSYFESPQNLEFEVTPIVHSQSNELSDEEFCDTNANFPKEFNSPSNLKIIRNLPKSFRKQ